MRKEDKILFFDGICNLCNAPVLFIIKKDKNKIFKFSALQSRAGQKFCQGFGFPTKGFNSIIYLRGDKYFKKSSAILYICKDLGGLWKLFFGLIILPKGIRDFCYDLIAKNRYKLFGKRSECMIPTPELRKRFLD